MGFQTMGRRRPLSRFMFGVAFLIWMASTVLLSQNPSARILIDDKYDIFYLLVIASNVSSIVSLAEVVFMSHLSALTHFSCRYSRVAHCTTACTTPQALQ